MPENLFKLIIGYSIDIIPAFLFALLLSAILAEILPDIFFEKVLSQKGFFLIILASIVGAFIPLCTCGMIPLASKLEKKGTPWPVVISFLTSGNASSITSITLTLVLGFKITFLRFLFAVLFGIIVAYVFSLFFKPLENTENKINAEALHATSLPGKISQEFFSLLVSFGPWVLAAVFIAALISIYLKPADVIKIAGTSNFMSPFLLSLSGFPFYFCAGTDVPVAKVLLDKGASLGSVLAFMTSAPGINLTSFLIYQRWIGIKSAVIYLMISFLVCGIMGLVMNAMIL